MSSNVSEGITTALLKFSEEKIKQLAEYFRTNKLKFLGNSETIKIAKEVRDSGELIFYKAYIKDKPLLFNIKLGLILRRVENDPEKLSDLREKIIRKFQIKGLHIAYFVQNGILNRYVGILLDNLDSAETLNKIIANTLENIEKHVVFVSWKYKSRDIIQETMTLSAQKPNILIISGAGNTRKEILDSESQLSAILKNYELEKMSTEKKEILFFKINMLLEKNKQTKI